MTDGIRVAALAGAASAAALAIWMLGNARIALSQGDAAAGALTLSAAALPLTQLLTLLLCGHAATVAQPLHMRLKVLLVMAAAPAPLAGIVFAMDAASTSKLVMGQLAVAAGIAFVAVSGWVAERVIRKDSSLLAPSLQIVGLLCLWTLHGMLAGRP